MFAIIGTKEEVVQETYGGPFDSTWTEFCVALFDNEEDALHYIHKSKLKKVQHVSYGADRVFRNSSRLSGYQDARVEWCDDEIVSMNPPVDW